MSDNARDQAIIQVESIVAMVAALGVDYDRLEELRDELEELHDLRAECLRLRQAQIKAVTRADSERVTVSLTEFETESGDRLRELEELHEADLEELAELEDAAGDCSDEEEARERIQDDPLSIEFRSDWCSYGDEMTPSEARIVLCTGGPHVEILCDLENGSPSRPRVIYKDWGTSGEIFDFDHDAVTRYLEQLYFGE